MGKDQTGKSLNHLRHGKLCSSGRKSMGDKMCHFQDKIGLENILFVSKSLNNLSPSIFNTWFSFSSHQHNYETPSYIQGNLMKRFYKTNRYGKY